MRVFQNPKLWLALSVLSSTQASAQPVTVLHAAGGANGGHFSVTCPTKGWVLRGLNIRAGWVIDAVEPICAGYFSPTQASSSQVIIGPMRGGSGGTQLQIFCFYNGYAVRGLTVGHGEFSPRVVNAIKLRCGTADGLGATSTNDPSGSRHGRTLGGQRYDQTDCPQGEVAVGIYGRVGLYVDALGLICAPAPTH
jgi:hypothetical protein